MRGVYVVKHAIATSLGNSVEATWQRLLKGHSALDAIRLTSNSGFGGTNAALVLHAVPI
jgi:3-oxoacyl-(acyl-carrier-protein) synthase